MSRFRFDPPPARDVPSLSWTLFRAFAPPGIAGPPVSEPRSALGLAVQLDVAARIGGRQSVDALSAELGFEAAAAFSLLHHACVRAEGVVIELAVDVARVARETGVPIVFLKFGALHFGGTPARGWRGVGDLDVL